MQTEFLAAFTTNQAAIDEQVRQETDYLGHEVDESYTPKIYTPDNVLYEKYIGSIEDDSGCA